MAGFFKVDRRILDWEWYNDKNVRLLWYHLLAIVNYKDLKWRGKTIRRGQVVTSLKHLYVGAGLSEQETRTALDKLESTGEITRETTNKYTLITVCKWDFYQVSEDTKQQTNNNQITNEQQTNNNQITTSKEYKEYKEIEEDKEYSLLLLTREAEIEEIEKMKSEDGLLESVAMLNHITREDVLKRLEEFKAHLSAGDYRHNKGQLRNHFRDWCRKRIQDEKVQQIKQDSYGNKSKYDPRFPYEPKCSREDYTL